MGRHRTDIMVVELEPSDKYRDLDAVNETIPKSEWRKGPNGKFGGPWERQHVGSKFVDIRPRWSGSPGRPRPSAAPAQSLSSATAFWADAALPRGQRITPLVTLADTFMPTRHGGRQRPHLPVKDLAACHRGRLRAGQRRCAAAVTGAGRGRAAAAPCVNAAMDDRNLTQRAAGKAGRIAAGSDLAVGVRAVVAGADETTICRISRRADRLPQSLGSAAG